MVEVPPSACSQCGKIWKAHSLCRTASAFELLNESGDVGVSRAECPRPADASLERALRTDRAALAARKGP